MRLLTSLLAVVLFFAAGSFAQDPQTAYCTFEDGYEVSMQYNPNVKEEPRNGRVWSPGITLFVQVPMTLGGSQIQLGAFSVHLIPDKKNWTLIVNRNVTAGSTYDPSQDVARAPMDIGEIPDRVKQLQLSFAHMGAKTCSLRVYYQKTGAFAEFMEK